MKKILFASVFLLSTPFAQENTSTALTPIQGEGLSLDIGGDYTWMKLTHPTYRGSTGGVIGKLTYQKPFAFFGQMRSVYNLGTLKGSANHTNIYDWYSEFVGGYCIETLKAWTITPYAGFGFDFLHVNQHSYEDTPADHLRYTFYYAIVGLDTHYAWKDWMFGLQADCLPIFDSYLEIKSLSDAAWTPSTRVGAAVRLPVAYRYVKNFWIELTPYYRFLPIGKVSALELKERNLENFGAFLTFRFFL